jgi:MATE family multidrug resistance protein
MTEIAYESVNVNDTEDPQLLSISKEEEKEDVNESWILSRKLLYITQVSAPVVTSFFLGISSSFILLYYAAHLNDTVVFAAVSMSNMFSNVSCISLLIGMTSAVETLGSQNNGAKNYKEVGIVLQRSIVVLSLMIIPIIVIWLYVEPIFVAVGTSKDICIIMKKYLRVRIFTFPIDIVAKSYDKYLMSMGVMYPSLYSTITLNVMIFILGGLFIHYFEFGYISLAYAHVISSYFSGLCLILSSITHPSVQRTLQYPTIEAFYNLREFVSLGTPGLAMLCSEWWAFEFLTIFASELGAAQVSAQTITMQMSSLAFMIPLGISVAASSLVGNAIGANNMKFAKELSNLCLITLLMCDVIISPTILFGSRHFIKLFTTDVKVIQTCSNIVPVIAVFTIFDGVQAVGSGIIRGAGKQSIGAITNIISYYLFGIPLAWFLCFHMSLKVNGLFLGISTGPIIQAIAMCILIYCFGDYIFYKKPNNKDEDVCDESALELVQSNNKLPNDAMEIIDEAMNC